MPGTQIKPHQSRVTEHDSLSSQKKLQKLQEELQAAAWRWRASQAGVESHFKMTDGRKNKL